MKTSLFLISVFIVGGALLSGSQEGFAETLETWKKVLPKEVLGWKSTAEDGFYDQKTIFDYIDGAGEVYRAYCMKTCLSRRYIAPQGPSLILDIFDMGSSEDAFGVFTHDQEGTPMDIGQDALMRPGWLSFWKDRYFVSVYAEEDTPKTKMAIEALGRTVASLIGQSGKRPEILSFLPREGLVPRSVRYLHNFLILNHHYYLSDEDILALGNDTEAALSGYQSGAQKALILLVRYPGPEKAEEAAASFRRHYLPEADPAGLALLENGKWSGFERRGGFLVIVLEADTRDAARQLLSSPSVPLR